MLGPSNLRVPHGLFYHFPTNLMPTYQQQATAYVRRWFKRSGWRVFPFQEETWKSYLRGEHGLVHSPTGTGKTLAVFLGAAIEWLAANKDAFRELKQSENATSETTAPDANAPEEPKPPGKSSIRKIPPAIKRTSIERLNRAKYRRRKLPPLESRQQDPSAVDHTAACFGD